MNEPTTESLCVDVEAAPTLREDPCVRALCARAREQAATLDDHERNGCEEAERRGRDAGRTEERDLLSAERSSLHEAGMRSQDLKIKAEAERDAALASIEAAKEEARAEERRAVAAADSVTVAAIDRLRTALATVTAERDEARTKLAETEAALVGLREAAKEARARPNPTNVAVLDAAIYDTAAVLGARVIEEAYERGARDAAAGKLALPNKADGEITETTRERVTGGRGYGSEGNE